jgi:hypothetical protein
MYHTQPPTAVNGYAFAFKTSADARVSYAIYPDGKDAPIVTGAPLRPRGGRPFAVVWDASKAAPGRYRAVLDGYMLDTNQRLHQTVRFAHQPAISEQSLPPLRE